MPVGIRTTVRLWNWRKEADCEERRAVEDTSVRLIAGAMLCRWNFEEQIRGFGNSHRQRNNTVIL